MNGVHAQLLQMVDSPWLRKRYELSRIFRIFTGNREIAVMHLIYYQVVIGAEHMTVGFPSLGIGILEIYHHTFLTVHAYRLGEHTRRSLSVHDEFVRLTFPVAFHRGRPDAVFAERHLYRVVAHNDEARSIRRSKEFENGLTRRVGHLIEVKCLVFTLTSHHQYSHSCNHQFLHILLVFKFGSKDRVNYFAMSEIAKPPPGASLSLSTSPFFTVFLEMV